MPLVSIPALIEGGMTVMEATAAAEAAAAASSASLLAPAVTTAQAASGTAGILSGGAEALGAGGAGTFSGGVSSLPAALQGGAGGIEAATATEAAAGAGGAGTFSGGVNALPAALQGGAGGAGVMTGTEIAGAGAGAGAGTGAGAGSVEANAANEAMNESVRNAITQGAGAPPAAPPANPVSAPYEAPPISNPVPPAEPATLPGDVSSADPYNWNNIAPNASNTSKLIEPSIQSAQNAANAASAANTSYAESLAPPIQGGTGISAANAAPTQAGNALTRGIKSALDFTKEYPLATSLGVAAASRLMQPEPPRKKHYKGADLSHWQASSPQTGVYTPTPGYAPMAYAVGGPVEQMSAQNAVGDNQMYPQAGLQTAMYSNPMTQRPMPTNVVQSGVDTNVDPYTGQEKFAAGGDVDATTTARNNALMGVKTPQDIQAAVERGNAAREKFGFGIVSDSDVDTRNKDPMQAATTQLQKLGKRVKVPIAGVPKSNVVDSNVFHAAQGGIMHGLGGYSDGGRLLKGPGDGVSDSIPATIGNRQPARLADGEFVVPARIVSELGNGSTEAGARKLYAMMERVQKSRKKSMGKDRVAVNSKADKNLPA